jgi:hypothetical protein
MSDPLNTDVPAGAEPVDEFAGIPAPRTRHPALALGAAALALFIIFHIRGDIAYGLSSAEPVDLGDARVLFATPGAVERGANRYVRVRGTPDRESALELDTKGSWTFTQFFRILGTGNRLFVHRLENPLPAARAERDQFEGRLIRFSDLSFEQSIRSYSASHVSATHFFRPDELRRAVASGAIAQGGTTTLRDLAGDPVVLGPNDLLAVDLARPDEVRLGFPRARFHDEAAARAEVEKRGGTVLSAEEAAAPPTGPAPIGGLFLPPTGPADRWMLRVRFPPADRDRALHEIGNLDPKIEIRDARQTFKVRVAEVGDGGDALILKPADGGAAPARLPIASIPAVRTLAAVQIPPDAWLLIENDLPRDHLRFVLFGGLLLMFAIVNLAGLVRGMRRT